MAGQEPKWQTQMTELEQRWFLFLGKLEERMTEMCEAAIPELRSVYKEDKGTYFHLLSGLEGQLKSILDKARDVSENQIDTFCDTMEDRLNEDDYEIVQAFSDKCSDSFDAFEEKLDAWTDKLRNTQESDLEMQYQAIIDEYDRIKNKFCCSQCGSPIPITQMYFIATYLTCPSCQSQNTFEPSTQARGLDFLGRELAQERTQSLLNAYEATEESVDTMYNQIHDLEYGDKNSSTQAKIAELESKRKEAIRNAPELYRIYLKAMFEEWFKLVPALEEQNRRIYEEQLKEFNNKNK